jgi:membrane-bound lytic murein transglycosylase MltF
MNKKIQTGIIIASIILMSGFIIWYHHIKNYVHDLPGIEESGRLSVLTDSSRMGFVSKGDSIYGFQYEIVKAFADSLGLELVITNQCDMNVCMKDLKSGDYDILANLIPVTSEWKKDALFTIPLFTSRQVLIQRIDTAKTNKKQITNHYQLLNDTIYIQYHSPYKMRLEHLSNEIAGTIHIIELKDLNSEQMVRMVSEGKIKYTICDEQFAKQLKIRYPNIDISLPVGFEQQLAWAVHKKSPLLLARLNAFLTDFIGSTAYWDIYRKYY